MNTNIVKYLVILTPINGGYLVRIPDFDVETQGESYEDALVMAKDALGLVIKDMAEEGRDIPEPNSAQYECTDQDILKYVYMSKREG